MKWESQFIERVVPPPLFFPTPPSRHLYYTLPVTPHQNPWCPPAHNPCPPCPSVFCPPALFLHCIIFSLILNIPVVEGVHFDMLAASWEGSIVSTPWQSLCFFFSPQGLGSQGVNKTWGDRGTKWLAIVVTGWGWGVDGSLSVCHSATSSSLT